MPIKPLSVITSIRHVGHQHEIFKLPFNFYALDHTNAMKWRHENRPWPDNLYNIPIYQEELHDVAIFFVNMHTVIPNSDEAGIIKVYEYFEKNVTDIPIIFVNNGTPHVTNTDSGVVIDRMKKLIRDRTMIVTSNKAKEEWGWGKVIWHGMDHNEWLNRHCCREKSACCCINPSGIREYFGIDNMEIVQDELGDQFVQISKDFKAYSFFEYRHFLSRQLVFYNPTRWSPMPRSRAEAMLSGCAIVTTGYYDEHEFIKNGVNGFIENDPHKAAKIIKRLLNNPEEAIDIGQRGRKTAMELFSGDRFRNDWVKLISKEIKKFNEKN